MWANAAEKGVMKWWEELPAKHLPITSKRHMNYLGTTMRMTPGKWPVIWVGQNNHKRTPLGVRENCANAKATQKMCLRYQLEKRQQ